MMKKLIIFGIIYLNNILYYTDKKYDINLIKIVFE